MRRLLLTLALAAGTCLAAAPAASAQGCMTKLPVSHSFKSNYAAAYSAKTLGVRVTSQGSWIHHAKAELYTFDGLRIAASRLRKRGFNQSRTFEMRLRFGALQAGKYTLIVTGEPNQNRSCGPKKYVQVVEFQQCPKSLPVSFPDAPGGNASDYGRWLSLNLRSERGLLRDVRVDVFNFDNVRFATGRIRALYGTAHLDMELKHKLVNGGYTVIVEARGSVPRQCGRLQATKVLRFGKQQAGSTDGGTTTESGSDAGGSGETEEAFDGDEWGTEEWGNDEGA